MPDDQSKQGNGDGLSGEWANPLRNWERLAAGIVGVSLGFSGVWAVFRSSNEAGTSLLLVVAAAFLFLGIQGTAIRRLGSESTGIELERRTEIRVRRKLAVEVREEARLEVNADRILGLADTLAIIEASPTREAAVFELTVQAALIRIGADIDRSAARMLEADFVAILSENEGPGVRILLELQPINGRFFKFKEWAFPPNDQPTLIVTNKRLPDVFRDKSPLDHVRLVEFRGSLDDGLLRKGLAALSDSSRPSAPSPYPAGAE